VSAGFELRTERLLLREWRDSDVEEMAAINRDPEVTEFLTRGTDEASVRASAAWLRDHWTRFGFGPLAIEGRDRELRGLLLGFAGVAYPEFVPELAARPELGWRLRRSVWGRGVATEAACAARDDAFGRLGMPELIAIINPANVRSQRVAAKVGMVREGRVSNPAQRSELDVWQLPA
jgi:RimJ/RimL family protein N-acetyltransferase